VLHRIDRHPAGREAPRSADHADDAYHTVEFDDHYVVQPNDVWWDRKEYLQTTGGKPVAEGFQYSSDANPVWMTREQLTALLEREAIEL